MNYSSFIIKLIDIPEQSSFENNIRVTEVAAQFSTKYKKTTPNKNILRISAWGDLSDNLIQNFCKGDLLVIEGIISLRDNYYFNNTQQNQKKIVEITISNFYPYFSKSKNFENLKSINILKDPEKKSNDNFPF